MAVACAALFFGMSGHAMAMPSAGAHVAPLRITVRAGHDVTRCTRGVPDSWEVATWVHVNGRDLPSTKVQGASLYYAGDGALVQLTTKSHGGPICARAMTWQQSAKVTVSFRVV
jgi:hypothetical protein